MSDVVQRRPMPNFSSHTMPHFHPSHDKSRVRTSSITIHTFDRSALRSMHGPVDQVPPHFFDEITPTVASSPMSNLANQMEGTHFSDYTTWDEHGATYPAASDPFNAISWDSWEHNSHHVSNTAQLYPLHEDSMDLAPATHISPYSSNPSLPSLPTSPSSSHGFFDPFSQAPPSSSISWFQNNQ